MATRNHRWRELTAAALVTIGLVLAFVAPVKPAQAAAGGDHLGPGQVLNPGEWIASGADLLILQTDGNLVIYSQHGVPLWASNTAGWSSSMLQLQSDGNVVIRAPGNVAIWHTDTYKQSYAVNRFPSYGWGQGYIKGRYDTPCIAWWMWNSRNPHWY